MGSAGPSNSESSDDCPKKQNYSPCICEKEDSDYRDETPVPHKFPIRMQSNKICRCRKGNLFNRRISGRSRAAAAGERQAIRAKLPPADFKRVEIFAAVTRGVFVEGDFGH